MSSAEKKGFVLTDALAAVAVVSMLACSVCWSVSAHEKTVRLVEKHTALIEEQTAEIMEGIEACGKYCKADGETETDSY